VTSQENIMRRVKSRTRVLMSATVISPEGSNKVLVRDISRTGAQVYADTKIKRGQDVCFKKGPIFVAAYVAWCKKGCAGLQFYRELTASERDAAFHTMVLTESDEA
jgi:hypothetical protein